MNKKIALIIAPLMVAMLVGTSYSLWSKTIFIAGTVNTGDIGVEWSLEDAWDTEPDEKDVSSISGEIQGDTLVVTITNAYPCIDYYLEFDIHGIGSVPVHLGDFVIDRGNLRDDATLEITDLSGAQLHYCNVVYGIIHVHLGNDAAQDDVYTFSAQITAGQWNEYPPG